jgi:hypothetical protein
MDKNKIILDNLLKDNSKQINITGVYQKDGPNYFFNKENDLLFKVCERKEHTRLKPKIYLVNRTQDNKFNFISSLYPNEQGNYIAEYQKIYYNVTLTETTLTIKKLNPYV